MKYWSELRGMPRRLWLLFAVALINRAGTMALPFLMIYVSQYLGFGVAEAGIIVGGYGIGSLAISPVAGWLCDRWGSLQVMLLSLFASTAAMLLFPLVHGYWPLLGATIAWAAVNDLFRPAAFTYLGEIVSPAKNKAAFAVLRLAVNLGMSVGPLLGGFVAARSFPWLFYGNSIATGIAGIVLWWFAFRSPAHRRSGGARERHSMVRSVRDSLGDPRLVYFLLALIPVELVFFQHESTLAHYVVHDLSLTEVDFGLLFTVNTAIICTLELTLNLATAHWPHRYNLAAGALLIGLGFGGVVFARTFGSVIATVAIWTFGEMLLFPQAQAYLNDIAPASRRGAYMGMYMMSFSIAFILGPTLGSAILDSRGAATLWVVCFITGLASTIMLWNIPQEAEASVPA